jgi:hypothetical protein
MYMHCEVTQSTVKQPVLTLCVCTVHLHIVERNSLSFIYEYALCSYTHYSETACPYSMYMHNAVTHSRVKQPILTLGIFTVQLHTVE